jgi:hypothetical protein
MKKTDADEQLEIYNLEKEYANRVKQIKLSKLGYNIGVQNFAEPFSQPIINKLSSLKNLPPPQEPNSIQKKYNILLGADNPLPDIIKSYTPKYPASLKFRFDEVDGNFYWGATPIAAAEDEIGQKLLVVSGRAFPFTEGLLNIFKYMRVITHDDSTLKNFISMCDLIAFSNPGNKIKQTKIYKDTKTLILYTTPTYLDFSSPYETSSAKSGESSSAKSGEGVNPTNRFLTLLAAKQQGHNNVDRELKSYLK